MKRWKKWAVLGVAVSVLMYPVTWVAVQHSDAYAKAIEFLRGNGKVNESVGEVEEVGLSFFGYSLRYSGAYGEANFEVELEGSNTTASAYVELKKKGVWEVTMASLSVPWQQPMRLKRTPQQCASPDRAPLRGPRRVSLVVRAKRFKMGERYEPEANRG